MLVTLLGMVMEVRLLQRLKVCQTFNVATGVSYNVSNTYYWRLCVATGTTSTTIDGETVECHYIDLSDSDKDSFSISAPTSGDNVVQLGNRNDSTRQAAIIISAYQRYSKFY